MIILFVVAALVRKVGVGMISILLFHFLSDLFHYGFNTEPFFFIYFALTYGLFIDIVIGITRGKIFGVGLTKYTVGLAALEGGIIGFLWSFPDPLLYEAFLKPFIFGAVVNWSRVIFDLLAFIPGDLVIGILGGLAANRVQKAVQV